MTDGNKIELTDGHKSWNNRISYRIQNKMTGGHKSGNRSLDNLVPKLDSEQVDGWSQHLEQKLERQLSVQQVDRSQHEVSWPSCGVRSDKKCRQITFGVDRAACRTVVPGRHPITRRYTCHWDAEARVPYTTAGKSVVKLVLFQA